MNSTRNVKTIDHCCTRFKKAYKATSVPGYNESNHAAIFPILKYKLSVLQEAFETHWDNFWSFP